MEHNCIRLLVFYILAFSQHASVGRKLSDGDYLEKTKEFPQVLKHLNDISAIRLLKDEYLHFYVPLKSTSKRCINDSKLYLQGLKKFDPWALQMLDSSSKLPSGFMVAHLQDFGNFDECLHRDFTAPISKQYCMVEFHGILPRPWLQYGNVYVADMDSPLQKQNVPRLSFCLPSSCTTQDISEHFTKFLSPWNGTASVDEYSCTTGKKPPLGVLDWFTLLCLAALNISVLISTIYELTVGRKYEHENEPPQLHRILTTFSLYKNGKNLLQIRDPKRSLSVINGLRVVSIVWILLGHYTLLMSLIPSVNYIYGFKLLPNWNMAWIRGAVFGVDTFFLISGFLLSYLFLKEFSSRERKFSFMLYFLHRYIRISPVYYMSTLLGSTVSDRLGDGPLWKPFAQRHTEYCQDNWWTNILYISNYVDPNRQCLGMTWYLCVDMHLYLLSPLVLFPLMKYRRFAVIGLPILLLVSMAIPFTIAYAYKLPAASVAITRDNRSAWNFSMEYIPTHNRAGPWVVGIALGYILHKLRGKEVHLSKFTVTCGWIISLGACLGTLYSFSYFHQDDYTYQRLLSALYVGLNRPLWASGVAWIIFACETGYGGFVRTFLSWRVFQPLGRLTFCIYFMHLFVLYITVVTVRTSVYQDYRIWIKDIMGVFLFAVFSAVYLTCLLEAPFLNIEKLLFMKTSSEEKETTQNDNTEKDCKRHGAAMKMLG